MNSTVDDYNLLARHYSIESAVKIQFKTSTGLYKDVTVRVGDEVTIEGLISSNDKIEKITGIVIDIINKRATNYMSFRANEKVGNGNYDLIFKIDVSTTKIPDIKVVHLIDIYDLVLGDGIEDLDPFKPIPGRDPQGNGEDVDKSEEFTITADADIGIVDIPERRIYKNDNAVINIIYDDAKSRMKIITINDVDHVYNKVTGKYDPELPSNIGIVETLPYKVNTIQLYATIIENGREVDVDLFDNNMVVDDVSKVWVQGSIAITILSVTQDYTIDVMFDENLIEEG